MLSKASKTSEMGFFFFSKNSTRLNVFNYFRKKLRLKVALCDLKLRLKVALKLRFKVALGSLYTSDTFKDNFAADKRSVWGINNYIGICT